MLLGFSAVLAQSPHGEDLVIDCAQCHNPAGWELDRSTMAFDHNNTTTFDLEGMHATADCRLCHEDLVFEGAQQNCVDCHDDIHSMTVGNDCVRCHDSNSWLVDEIPELHEANGFPLLGTHANLSCVECHINETNFRFDRLGNECINCHNDDYLATETPNHVAVGYSTDCAECHSSLGFAWGIGSISHDFFPLELGHDIEDCNMCHTSTTFSEASPDCINCHQTDFNETINPSHTQLGLSNDCAQCHTLDLNWMPARFDIHDQFYALNGAHAEIANDCAECHNGDYVNLPPTDCFGCHESDYNSASPNHATIGFSTDCIQCHTEDEWDPSTFDHDGQYFPINSGSHQGEWNACTDCHTTPGNLTIFDCLNCHKENNTNNEHDGVNGYVYQNDLCLQCHPDGESD
ncbi:MAG: hypothetical protein AAFN10_16295 [Bacteroidota bacterium]